MADDVLVNPEDIQTIEGLRKELAKLAGMIARGDYGTTGGVKQLGFLINIYKLLLSTMRDEAVSRAEEIAERLLAKHGQGGAHG